MNLRRMVEFQKQMENGQISEDGGELDRYFDETDTYINDKSRQGEKLILSKMNEEDFARAVNEVGNLIISSMCSEGYGVLLALSRKDGSMQVYTHTVVLTVLAMLMDEEVI